MINEFVFRNDEGGTIDMIQILIGILALTFLLFINIGFTNTVGKRNNIELVAHEYILRMETEGRLTNEAEEELVKTLTDMGMVEIDIIHGTSTPVIYGDVIKLEIKGKLVTTSFVMSNVGFKLLKDDTTSIPVNITKTSVSRFVK